MRDLLKIDFADVKGVEVKSFNLDYTFSRQMEGSWHSCSLHILARLIEDCKKEGHFFQLTPDQLSKEQASSWDLQRVKDNDILKPDEVLKPYLYSVYAEYEYENRLYLYWFGDAPSSGKSIADIINERTKFINFNDYRLYVDLDDF